MKSANKSFFFCVKIIFLIFYLIIAAFFSACSDIHDDAFVYIKSNYVYVSLALSESTRSGVIVTAQNDNTRTILPVAIDLTDTSKYNFYIWGKSSKGNLSPRKVDFDSKTTSTGTIELNFPAITYTFVLAATEGIPSDITDPSKILEESILVGYTNADLAYTNKIKFYLAPNEISGFGDINLSILLDSSWSDDDVTALSHTTDSSYDYIVSVGLYDINTGELSFSSAAQNVYGLNKITSSIYTRTLVPSGTYNFTVKIKKTGSSKIYNYSDRVILYPNQNINETLKIPNIVEKVPAAPSEFKAAYCMDSRLYENTTGNESEYTSYGLLLSWKDNSNNESNFKITLANISKTSTSIDSIPEAENFTDLDWTLMVNPYAGNTNIVKVYDDAYTKSPEYYAGSPEKNNTAMILYIPFDGCYIAKIEAVNDAGVSKACYATIDEDFFVKVKHEQAAYGYFQFEGKAFKTSQNPTCNVINLYHIIYNLVGGEYKYEPGKTSPTEGGVVDYGIYGLSKSFLTPISTGSEASSDNPSLIFKDEEWKDNDGNILPDSPRFNARWHRWVVNSYFGINLIETSIGGTTIPVESNYTYQKPNAYTGYTSLYLFARYD